ncbi:hypothetical protein BGX27_009612 [Mortierella sp. AM989]|nr:hypothetical protein BGX27_009612 [Mortierella sp. AM989]
MGPYRIVHADPVLYVQDLESTQLGNKGWICTDLETLRVCYRTCNRVKEVPVVLRQHIAKLRKLRDLRLHCNNPYDNLFDKGCVQDALREWGVLSELRTLELRGLKQLVDRKELSKTRKQWTKLEWIQFS